MSIVSVDLRTSRWFAAIGGLLFLLAICQALPAEWQAVLRYDRVRVTAGEVWRLLTPLLVHLGWAHLLLNATGLVLISVIFGADWPAWRWLLALGLSGLVSTLGVHLANPEVYWLVGLSGALHGLFAFGAVGWVRQGDRIVWLLLAGLEEKVLYEQWTGSLALSEAVVGGPFIVGAHLWGSVGGLTAAGVDRLCFRPAPAPL